MLYYVLILVLVEHTLGGGPFELAQRIKKSLNPCFSGTYSRSICNLYHSWCIRRLNPCFSGTYSRRYDCPLHIHGHNVLILVLVEHTLGVQITQMRNHKNYSLNPCFSGTYSRSRIVKECAKNIWRLNPCFSGTYSRRAWPLERKVRKICLNPCFSGTYSRRATFTTYTISKYYACKFGIFICF